MQPDEIQIAIDWAANEGWNPGLYDAALFRIGDPNGFFIGTLGNLPVAVGSAVTYDDHFAFCGLYIVHPDYRGQGYGIALTRARLDYVGTRNAGIDGVIENIPIYERIGYRLVHYNARYRGVASPKTDLHPAIIELSEIPFSQVERYDRACFPAPRGRFLHAWITQQHGKASGFVENDILKGLAVRRKCVDGHKIGPLFADSIEIAEQLLESLLKDIPGEAFYLDITRSNPAAADLAEKFAMQEVFGTGRMYLKDRPELADQKIFGISTFELG